MEVPRRRERQPHRHVRRFASALAVGTIAAAVALVAGGTQQPSSVGTGQPPIGDHHELTYDEQLGAVAEQVPSFAGLYVDGEVYVIKVTDGRLESAEAARRAAAQILNRPDLATAQIRPEPADFSWKQLLNWYQAISKRVWELADVTMTDIDEMHNIITIGVSNLERDEPAVRAVAEAEGVPAAALEVIEREPVRLEEG